MSKEKIPRIYIIALLLGIAFVAILVWYWFFDERCYDCGIQDAIRITCDSKLSFYCNSWKVNNYDPEKKLNGQDFSAACNSITEDNKDNYYAPECCIYAWAQSMTPASCENLT